MLEITFTVEGIKSWMYFLGSEAKAKAHFNKQVKECGYKKTKLLSIAPLIKTTNEKVSVITITAPSTSKRKSTRSRNSAATPATPTKRNKRNSGNTSRRSTKQ